MFFARQFPQLAAQLERSYAQPHRHYHNWHHIAAMLQLLHELRSRLLDSAAVELAIYYHDAVYRPLLVIDEFSSARRLRRELNQRIEAQTLARAVALVRATALHRLPRDMPDDLRWDCAHFLDIDLAVLAGCAEQFDAYERSIRAEYSALPDAIYRSLRKKVFRRLLQRPSIYHSEVFLSSHEHKARGNLLRYLDANG